MTQVSTFTGIARSNNTTKTNDFNNLTSDDFLQLMITELQQQDPLNPTDTKDMVQQISAIRSVAATTGLNKTLDAVLTGQNLATASGLVGKKVKALTDDAKDIQGIVDRVSIKTTQTNGQTTRTLRVHIGDKDVDLKNIREITPNK